MKMVATQNRMPKRNRFGDKKEKIGFAIGQSSVGKILVASCELGVVAILAGQDADTLLSSLKDRFPKTDLHKDDTDAKSALPHVIDFIEKPDKKLNLALYIKGTLFQKRVWQAVQEIPVGQTATYADIARAIGKPRAMRAVGNTCSWNNLFMAVPCHRVIRSDGSVSGARQRMLIDREARQPQKARPAVYRNPRENATMAVKNVTRPIKKR